MLKSLRVRIFAASSVGVLALALVSTESAQAATYVDSSHPTPDTALVVSGLPFEGDAFMQNGGAPATDPANQAVADACNGGQPIYQTAWYKIAPARGGTVLARIASTDRTAGVYSYNAWGAALVTSDGTVSCGYSFPATPLIQLGPASVAPGSYAYVVEYAPTDVFGNEIAVEIYPTSGIAPANDTPAGAATIGSLPFTDSVDTTLAGPPGNFLATAGDCDIPYDKFYLPGPFTWYAYTPPVDQTVQLTLTGTGYDGYFAGGLSEFRQFVFTRDATGNPGTCVLGTESFPAWVDLQAGTTYLFAEGTGDYVSGGTLTLNAVVIPPLAAVALTTSTTATVNSKTGVATVRGTATCTGDEVSSTTLTGTLTQPRTKASNLVATFTGGPFTCDGTTHAWTATAQATAGKFAHGTATATTSATATNPRGTANSGTTTTSLTLAESKK